MEQPLPATEVKAHRIISSRTGGRMPIKADAPDQLAVERFFEAHYANCERIVQINLDAHETGIRESKLRSHIHCQRFE